MEPLSDLEICRRLALMRGPLAPTSRESWRRLAVDVARCKAVEPAAIVVADGNYGERLGERWDDGLRADADAPDCDRPGASGLDRWPATLHPDHAERCYYSARAASRRWVDGLATRGGIPRWDRIRRCGDPEVVFRPIDGAISWEHRWCRDRACYACARSRSRRLAHELRDAVCSRSHRGLYFVTLTQPKHRGESCQRAWDRALRAWTALRHSPQWKREIAGGVRVVEVTHSRGHARARDRFVGWHVHFHCVIELRHAPVMGRCPACAGRKRGRGGACRTCGSNKVRPSGELPDALSVVLARWLQLASGASIHAQCAVPLDLGCTGQLTKYLTKLWELDDVAARELFLAASGRRTIDGFGGWRSWRHFGARVEAGSPGWLPSGIRLRTVELMDPAALVAFDASLGLALDADGRDRWRPRATVVAIAAGRVLAALRVDDRPAWARAAPSETDSAQAAAIRAALAQIRKDEFRGVLASSPCRPSS